MTFGPQNRRQSGIDWPRRFLGRPTAQTGQLLKPALQKRDGEQKRVEVTASVQPQPRATHGITEACPGIATEMVVRDVVLGPQPGQSWHPVGNW